METKTEIKKRNGLSADIVDQLVLRGDLSGLTQPQKIEYYRRYCERLGLDPMTQPFKLLKLSNREILYCDRSGTQQLSHLHNVSHKIVARETVNDCYVVTATALTKDRSTDSIGAVNIANLKGDALCNAMMKAETKAKRRATLDLLGLGILDETETETIPGATVAAIEVKAEPVTKMENPSPYPFDEQPILNEIQKWDDLHNLSAYYDMLNKNGKITATIKTAFTLRKQQIKDGSK